MAAAEVTLLQTCVEHFSWIATQVVSVEFSETCCDIDSGPKLCVNVQCLSCIGHSVVPAFAVSTHEFD